MAMEEGALSCLLRSRPVLEQDIKATYLMDHLISDAVTDLHLHKPLSRCGKEIKANRTLFRSAWSVLFMLYVFKNVVIPRLGSWVAEF